MVDIKTAETVCYEIFREILREARQFDTSMLLVLASQEVIDLMIDEVELRLQEHKVTLSLSEAAKDWLADKGFDWPPTYPG